ncbi:glycosyl hydrolase 3 family [Rhizoctonia solani]|uniref:beta-glucosidase n=1 Tax=Rhizoctonia solani TaxID=456999 RepID=A0A8H7M0X8_9AGAM|nr:glycosyl hydrolase 3 family [Rhizoctonia solani]
MLLQPRCPLRKLGALFDNKDPDSANIGINGTIQWCEDLGVDPEDVSLLAVACELKSPTVGEWTKNGRSRETKRSYSTWRHGDDLHSPPILRPRRRSRLVFFSRETRRICVRRDDPCLYLFCPQRRCDTIDQMKTTIATLRTKLGNDPDYFSRVYTYTFTFAKTEGARSIPIESAIAFWNLLLSVGLSGSALPKNGWTDEHTEWWFEFLKERGGKGVSKDTWAMLPEFIKVIDGKFENHDLEAAWPSTIDDFVEWAKEKTQAGQTESAYNWANVDLVMVSQSAEGTVQDYSSSDNCWAGWEGVMYGSSSVQALDIEDTISKLSLNEKTRLLAGIDMWHTYAVPRLGIPSLRFTDGPNGARGTKFFEGVPAACFPAATGLGSSWDVEFIEKVGQAIGRDCKDKGCHVLLGPTINIQRSPLGGRGFESYSEDPLLSGTLARAFIKGVQSEGVSATIKHYVTNDSEFERMSMSSELSTRALREIYLRAFEIACRDPESAPWALMTAYNRVNGLHASENKYLLDSVLRKQWGWDGLIMSDWYGTYSADASIKAGLDLEMPGPPTWRADALQRCVTAQKIRVPEIDDRTGEPEPETVSLLREAAAHANVLLKNSESLLPLSAKDVTSIGVIGPNADAPVFSGGGSANLRPYKHTTALEGIAAALADAGNKVEVQYTLGAHAHKEAPLLGAKHLKTKAGEPGYDIEWFNEDPVQNPDAKRVHYNRGTTSFAFFNDNLPTDDILHQECWATMTGIFTPDVTGKYEFGAAATGLVDVYVDGKKIIDNSTNPVPGHVFFMTGTVEVCNTVELTAGKPVEIKLQFTSPVAARARGFTQGIKEAVDLAKKVDKVVLVVGLNNDWESEGYDRDNMELPRATNRLVSAVLEANKNTAVVVISGTPVSMPWADTASTIVQSFYSGGEAGHGLADVLFGKVNPSSRLPLSFPVRDEDTPSYLNFPGQNGKVLYVLFPFGHGLSYTQFEHSNLKLSGKIGKDSAVGVSVTVKNTGKHTGRDVVQVYVRDIVSRLDRPVKELKGFAKSSLLEPGKSETVTVTLDKYAFAYFDDWAGEGRDGEGLWVAEAGDFEVIVSSTSEDAGVSSGITLEQSFEWI